jgi:hypothetical protein
VSAATISFPYVGGDRFAATESDHNPRASNEVAIPNEEYVSDALDLMIKAGWVKQYGQGAKGLRVDWTDRGKLAMDVLGYVIEDLGRERLNEQL